MVDLLFTSEYYNLEYLKKKRPQLSTLMWDLGYCYRSWTCQISKLVPKFQEWSSCCNYLDGAENWKSTWTLYRLSTKSAVICLSVQETLTCKLRWKLAAEQGFQSQVTHGCLARGILKLCYHVSQKYWAKVGCSWEKCLNTEQCFLLQKKLSDIKKAHAAKESRVTCLRLCGPSFFFFFAFFPPPYIILSDKQSLKILDVHTSLFKLSGMHDLQWNAWENGISPWEAWEGWFPASIPLHEVPASNGNCLQPPNLVFSIILDGKKDCWCRC